MRLARPMPPEIDVHRLLATAPVARVEHYPSLSSTNDRARSAAGEPGMALPLLVIADEQSSGRGRGSNRWWTGAGSLAASLLFEPAASRLDPLRCRVLALVAAVAVVDTVAPLLRGRAVGLHWPNDVYTAGKKLCGVLVEALADQRYVVGIGLNLNNTCHEAPADVRRRATSVLDLTGSPHDKTDVLLQLLTHWHECLQVLAADPERLGARFDALCLQHGELLTLYQSHEPSNARSVSGICAGIGPDGSLLLDTAAGRRAFFAGTLAAPPIARYD
ncbi:MAG: biotin--[acetyl-CoA-carboxylase] ligase [Planctomycetes bacterium]|nr:biotin--[acetyl-CoA-carboxylase] ligase [Planctomycetota bacterium]